ncbi:hypothetical protein BDZ91DRAFT_753262 [Kalaharituber pfeilii]|nr:hypothetical protein BDZ91DRAFT_753262 [Kalaharituber pfeilii]
MPSRGRRKGLSIGSNHFTTLEQAYHQLPEKGEHISSANQSPDDDYLENMSQHLLVKGSEEQKDPPIYPSLPIKTFLLRTFPFIFCNLLCLGLFVVTLKIYGDKRLLKRADRRGFNAILLFLAAAITMGIGFFLDQIGYMLRGRLLMELGNTKQEVGHIWRGTIGSYTLLVWCHLRRRSFNVVTLLALGFVLVNMFSRLSIGFFGFTYTLEHDEAKGRLTWWPQIDEKLEIPSNYKFDGETLTSNTLLEILWEITKDMPLQQPPSWEPQLDADNRTDLSRILATIFNVPDLILLDETYAENSTNVVHMVGYAYGFNYDIDESILIPRPGAVVYSFCEDMDPKEQNYFRLNTQSSVFHPVSRGDSGTSGWMMLKRETNLPVGDNYTATGFDLVAARNAGASYEFNISYSCEIFVGHWDLKDFQSSFGNESWTVPSDALLTTLSSFLATNETQDSNNVSERPQWLPHWEVEGKESPPPAVVMGGALARAVALVLQYLGDKLRKKDARLSDLAVMGLMSVNWPRVAAIFCVVAGLQILIAAIAGKLVVGTLRVEDDVDSMTKIVNSESFQDDETSMPPWVIERAQGTNVLTYRCCTVVPEKAL